MAKTQTRPILELEACQVEALLERVRQCLDPEDCQLIEQAFENLGQVQQLLQQKNISIARLRRLVFGQRTEKTDSIKKALKGTMDSDDGSAETSKEKPKPKGHGRNGAADYPGARRLEVTHSEYRAADPCPLCPKGKLYDLNRPGVILNFQGRPFVEATLFELQKLRCNTCGKVFTASAPPEAGDQKYDPSVGVMLAVMRYGAGLPFYRIETLQESLGVPLAPSTQWELVEDAAQPVLPVLDELMTQAAQSPVIFNDDTNMKILDFASCDPPPVANPQKRTGIFTTAVVAQGEHPIVLFFSGRLHAGENLKRVLDRRESGLPPPIHMCDGLSRNHPKPLETKRANCNSHARRNYTDIAEHFPDPCLHVLESLKQVYRNDKRTKNLNLTPQERLDYHQRHSASMLGELKTWMEEQMASKQVEPNSALGGAFNYMLDRWEALTLFLREPGAPLDNNITERALKMAIKHRKNSLFYRTQNGARVGDLFMSLIHTCQLNAVNPFDYLNALCHHANRVEEDPTQWLPWNYKTPMSSAAQSA